MAKLKVSATLLEELLFETRTSFIDARIIGAKYIPESELVEFEVVGSDVPDCDEVDAIVHHQPEVKTVKFVKR